jgi:hypothetical protein
MRPILTGSAITTALLLVSLAACKKEEPPAQAPPTYQTPPPGYAQPAPYGQPVPGQPAPTMAPAPGAAPAPVPAAPAAGMNPNPQGVPCTSDAQCLTHKCNVAAQKCSWPCQGPGDCAPGMQCLAPICVPSVPGAAPAPAK